MHREAGRGGKGGLWRHLPKWDDIEKSSVEL